MPQDEAQQILTLTEDVYRTYGLIGLAFFFMLVILFLAVVAFVRSFNSDQRIKQMESQHNIKMEQAWKDLAERQDKSLQELREKEQRNTERLHELHRENLVNKERLNQIGIQLHKARLRVNLEAKKRQAAEKLLYTLLKKVDDIEKNYNTGEVVENILRELFSEFRAVKDTLAREMSNDNAG